MVEDRRAAPLRTPQVEDRGQDNRRISFRKASMTAYDHKPCVSAPRPTVTPDTAVSRVTEVPIDKDYTHLLQGWIRKRWAIVPRRLGSSGSWPPARRQLQEQEWFVTRRPEIADAPNAAPMLPPKRRQDRLVVALDSVVCVPQFVRC